MSVKELVKEYLTIQQNGFTMYLMKIKVSELLESTFVDLYDHNTEEGYQRRLVPDHYRKIARFLLESPNPIMPSSVICAIDSKCVKLTEQYIIFTDKLRIVDGQHRREGFRYFFEKYRTKQQDYLNYELPMIVLVIDTKKDKIIEVETFVNINSKGKPVKTDLAVDLREKLREKEDFQFDTKADFVESLATNITKLCNELPKQPWYDKIRLAEEVAKKPIGLNTFKKAMEPVVSSYVDYYKIQFEKMSKKDSLYEETINKIANLFVEAWKAVYKKWEEAFEYYNDYNIMKSVGIFSINQILAACIEEQGENGIYFFEQLIYNSNASAGIWRRGGEFSGLSSSQGFKIIAERIMREDTE